MINEYDIVRRVRSALRRDARIHVTRPIKLAFADGVLTMEGEVSNVIGKKLALESAARLPEVTSIIDRFHVRAATQMSDGEIRVHVRNALLEEPILSECTIREEVKGQLETVRDPPGATGIIHVRVSDGIVTLDGDVAGIGQKRFAGVLAWWVPGSRDVINGLGVTPPEQESEAATTDTVRQILEKDHLINAESIIVNTRGSTVYLDGTVSNDAEHDFAENDAWYVFGVDSVVNRLTVKA